jgi:hypothetical protein
VEDDKQPGYIVTMKTEKMWKRWGLLWE